MEDIKSLKLEIEVLKKRVEILENRERRRKIFAIIKAVLVVIVIIAIIFAGLYLYQMIKGYYDQLNNMVTNPFDLFSGINLPTF